jgi:hypothetical protein
MEFDEAVAAAYDTAATLQVPLSHPPTPARHLHRHRHRHVHLDDHC